MHVKKLFLMPDISSVIIAFAKEYEKFDSTLSHHAFLLYNELKSLTLTDPQKSGLSAFGKVIAVPGRKYHWKLKILTSADRMSIGVVEDKLIDTANANNNDSLWLHQNGYSYRTDGYKYGKSHIGKYSNGYGNEGDIIDVYLDLRFDDVYLSFGKNGIKYGNAYGKSIGTSRKFMMKVVNYRLVICVENPY